MRPIARLALSLVSLVAAAQAQDRVTIDTEMAEIRTTFAELVAAMHWRQRNASRDAELEQKLW